MTLYDRYLLGNLFAALVKVLLALVFIIVLVDIITHRQDNIISYEIPLGIVARYYLNFSQLVLFQYQVVAVAVLVAALMVLGRAAQDNELTACFAGGAGIWRVARAPILFALLTAVAAFALEDQWGSRAAREAYALESRYFLRASDEHRGGISWTNLGGEWTCHIMKFNRIALTGQDVYLYSKSAEEVREIRANRIYWDETSARWILEDGRSVTFNPRGEWEQKITRITQAEAPFHEAPQELFALENPPETKSARALLADLHYAQALNIPVNAQWISLHAKFARPAVCLIMIFIAIPFALRVRRGGIAIGFGLSIAIGLAYMLLYYAGIGLGHLHTLPPFAAAWLANVVFACVAGALCYRTPS